MTFSEFWNSYSKSCYFFDSNNVTIKTYWDDTINGNEQCWRKNSSKKVCLSQTKGKNHKDWLYSGFGNFYSKSCNFFGGYQMTLKTLVFNNVEVK